MEFRRRKLRPGVTNFGELGFQKVINKCKSKTNLGPYNAKKCFLEKTRISRGHLSTKILSKKASSNQTKSICQTKWYIKISQTCFVKNPFTCNFFAYKSLTDIISGKQLLVKNSLNFGGKSRPVWCRCMKRRSIMQHPWKILIYIFFRFLCKNFGREKFSPPLILHP